MTAETLAAITAAETEARWVLDMYASGQTLAGARMRGWASDRLRLCAESRRLVAAMPASSTGGRSGSCSTRSRAYMGSDRMTAQSDFSPRQLLLDALLFAAVAPASAALLWWAVRKARR